MPTRRKLATDAWGSLLRVHAALVPSLDKAVHDQTGLPLSWYDVLLELQAEPEGRLRMSALAERVTLSRTRVSRVVDTLVDKDYVAREGHPDDRRSAFAVITDAGRAAFRVSAPTYVRAIEIQFATHLTNDELETLARVLTKVLDASGKQGG